MRYASAMPDAEAPLMLSVSGARGIINHSMTPDVAAGRVARGHGVEGSALEYLANTLEHLAQLGIKESPLHGILEMARRLSRLPRR